VSHSTAPAPHGFMATTEDCEYVSWPGRDHHFWIKASTEQTGGSFSLTESQGAANSSVGLHIHDAEDEAFYILDGEYRFTVADQEFLATAGSLVFIPRGTWHGFTIGQSDARCLSIFSPGGYEEVFREVSIAMRAGADTSQVFARLGAKHHTRFCQQT
jgi:quercetin dioxygenase-like cupin family protein